jgi:hypothetical protein
MPARDAMTHDLFISYASDDRTWAERLAADLEQRGVKVFLDQLALRDGQAWEPQLDAALDGSKHLVCLWSARSAEPSRWVHREIGRVMASNRKERRVLIVQLDDTKNAYGSLQQIVEPALKPGYPGDPAAADAKAWQNVVARIDAVVKEDPNALVVPVTLFTLVAPEVAALAKDDVEDAVDILGLNPGELATRYQAGRAQWRPFGGDMSFDDLLSEVKKRLDGLLAPRWVRWLQPDDEFLRKGDAGQRAAEEFAGKMLSEKLGAIVIDPVALCSATVLNRLALFDGCLKEEGVAVIALLPRRASEETQRFRKWLEQHATHFLRQHFAPDMPTQRARFGIGLDDSAEILRLLRGSVGVSMALRQIAEPAAAVLDNHPRT